MENQDASSMQKRLKTEHPPPAFFPQLPDALLALLVPYADSTSLRAMRASGSQWLKKSTEDELEQRALKNLPLGFDVGDYGEKTVSVSLKCGITESFSSHENLVEKAFRHANPPPYNEHEAERARMLLRRGGNVSSEDFFDVNPDYGEQDEWYVNMDFTRSLSLQAARYIIDEQFLQPLFDVDLEYETDVSILRQCVLGLLLQAQPLSIHYATLSYGRTDSNSCDSSHYTCGGGDSALMFVTHDNQAIELVGSSSHGDDD